MKGKLIALDLKKGETQWEFAEAGANGLTPTIAGTAVYVAGESGTVRALALTDGKELWPVSVGDSLPFAPVCTNGIAVVVDVFGTVSAIARRSIGGTPPTP